MWMPFFFLLISSILFSCPSFPYQVLPPLFLLHSFFFILFLNLLHFFPHVSVFFYSLSFLCSFLASRLISFSSFIPFCFLPVFLISLYASIILALIPLPSSLPSMLLSFSSSFPSSRCAFLSPILSSFSFCVPPLCPSLFPFSPLPFFFAFLTCVLVVKFLFHSTTPMLPYFLSLSPR